MNEKINLVTVFFILSITFCSGQEAKKSPLTPPGPNLTLQPRAVPQNSYQEPYRPQIHFSCRGISTYFVGGNVKMIDFKFNELASIWKYDIKK